MHIFKDRPHSGHKDKLHSGFKEKLHSKLSIRKMIPYCLVTILLFTAVLLIQHDYSWYDSPIVKIERAANEMSSQSRESAGDEKYYDQLLTGKIMNGADAGQPVTMKNTYSSSQVYDEMFREGDDVFVTLTKDSSGNFTGTINGLKRDTSVAFISALLIFLIFAAAKRKGILSILSLVFNIGLLYFALRLYTSGHDLLMLCNGLILLFTASSLFFISGFTKKTLVAIFATLVTLFLTFLLFLLVMRFTDGVDYAFMEYIAMPNDLPQIFLSQILIGGLGAIMDVSITEASAIHELTAGNSGITIKELVNSGREIGYDIMGTMINVMLFTYISGSIPLIILKMKSDVRLHTIILWHMPMELYRFLIGSIGILLSIPVSLLVSILIFKKLRRFS